MEGVLTDEIIELSPEWDAVLVVRDQTARKKFRVQSLVLSSASTSFKTTLRSRLFHGTSVRGGKRPEVILEGDSPVAMEIILSIIHCHNLDKWKALSAKDLALVAIHSDRYECAQSLWPWTFQWLFRFQVQPTSSWPAEDFGYLLAAMHASKAQDQFYNLCNIAVNSLPVDFDFKVWDDDPIMASIPNDAKAHITSVANATVNLLRTLLSETVESLLRRKSEVGTTNNVHCGHCHTVYDQRAKSCPKPSCSHDVEGSVTRVLCTWERRMGCFMQALAENDLWPPERAFAGVSLSVLMKRFEGLQKINHGCSMKSQCHLSIQLDHLEGELATAVFNAQKPFHRRTTDRARESSGGS
ncbi:hypothetical protein C8034_v002573 [Colletotrichum sidae]|uniref:BTB domain-containing protein n=1 Tax=Colletotrichum sidae TaxID=1347389 RepID=A0A4R8TBP2_9PEZI|nr:hypothetical protein C8034_v002573 [Colletotrichum sidae]